MTNKSTIISVSVQVPEPKPEYKKPSLEEKVDEYIRRVEANDIDSAYEWNYLKKLYEKLVCYPPKEVGSMLEKLEDLFEKYANKDSHNSVEIDAQTMHRYGLGVTEEEDD